MATITMIFFRVKTLANFLKGTWKLGENIRCIGGGEVMGVTTIYFGGDVPPPILEKYQSVPPNNRPIVL